MKRLLTIILLGMIALSAHAANIGYTEDPLKISIGARAMGMGGVYAAVFDGHNNSFNNPAGIANQKLRVSSMSTSLLGDVSYLIAGANWPVKFGKVNGGVGLGLAGSSVGQLITTSQAGFSYFDYHNNVWVLSYGQKILNADAGLRLKYFDEGFTGSQSYAGSGYDMDFGLLFNTIWNKTKIGLVVSNVLPTNLGGKILWPNGDYESVPMSAKAGISSRYFTDDLLAAFDYDFTLQRKYPAMFHGGLEWSTWRGLKLRGGLDQGYNAGAVNTAMTFGVGIMFRSFVFDYAYHPYFESSDIATHYFSISYGIDEELLAKPAEDVYIEVYEPTSESTITTESITIRGKILSDDVVKVISKEREALIAADKRFKIEDVPVNLGKTFIEVAALDSNGKILKKINIPVMRYASFSDVPEKYWAKDAIVKMATLQIIKGYPDNTFRPEGGVTRTDLLNMINKIKGKNEVESVKPEKPLNRAEAVSLIIRQFKLPKAGALATYYPDVTLKHWASSSIFSAKNNGLLDYITGSFFEPKKEFTRAEAAYILSKIKQ